MVSSSNQGIPPIIIIGMHRSGTSMLAQTLSRLGIYIGRNRTRNEECRWTNRINYWIFDQASATWERPEGMDTLMEVPDLCHIISDYMQGIVNGPSCARYLGFWRWMRYRSLFQIEEPWGWKDPRNTFTLPLWLRLFPQAKVLHIIRHGVDVAQSLCTRRYRAAEAAARRYWNRRGIYINNPLAPKRSGFAHSPRIASLEGGISLWEAYTMRGRSWVHELKNQALEVRYEDLLQNSEHILRQITEFCGIKNSGKILSEEAKRFNPDRAFAYRKNTALRMYAKNIISRLEEFGYGA